MIFQTSLTGIFNSGSTPTEVSGITISCLPSMTNGFFVNLYGLSGDTININSNCNWLHVNTVLSYTADLYSTYLITYMLDYNSVVDNRVGTISIVSTKYNSITWTVTQSGITPDRMTETELNNWLITNIEA
jgi:hypothetical protein